MTTIPRRANSMAILACVSFDLWKPGTTTTRGAGFSLVAESGRYKSAAIHCPFCVGRWIPVTRTCPQEFWIREAKNDATSTIATPTASRLQGRCFAAELGPASSPAGVVWSGFVFNSEVIRRPSWGNYGCRQPGVSSRQGKANKRRMRRTATVGPHADPLKGWAAIRRAEDCWRLWVSCETPHGRPENCNCGHRYGAAVLYRA